MLSDDHDKPSKRKKIKTKHENHTPSMNYEILSQY